MYQVFFLQFQFVLCCFGINNIFLTILKRVLKFQLLTTAIKEFTIVYLCSTQLLVKKKSRSCQIGIPGKRDPGSYEHPGPYVNPGLYEDPGPYGDPGPQENSKFFDDSGKTQEFINQVKFLDFLSHFTKEFPHHACNLVKTTKEGRFINQW